MNRIRLRLSALNTDRDKIIALQEIQNKINELFDLAESGFLVPVAAVEWDSVQGKPEEFPPSEHNHDDLYYRKAQVYNEEEVDDLLEQKANVMHTHDDRYYTQMEIDALLDSFDTEFGAHLADLDNPHQVTASQLTSGNLPYAQLPTGGGTWANGGDLVLSGALYIGVVSSDSPDPGIAVARIIDDSATGHGHGFSDVSMITRSGGIAYNAFDARVTVAGSANYDHFVAFQDNVTVGTSGIITNYYSMFSSPELNTGTITNRHGWVVGDYVGTAVVGTQYGLRVLELTKAGVNWAIKTEGVTPSSFNGPVTFESALDVKAGIRITGTLYRGASASSVGFSGGTSVNLGGNFLLYGESHATLANVVQFRAGTSSTWTILSSGIFEATGAQTIRTTTGNLSLSTIAGNGSISMTAHGTGVVEITKATGSATIEPATLRIRSSTNAADWSIVDAWGRLNFYSNDGSGPGAGVRASIGAIMEAASGATVGLTFSTSSASGLAERMRINSAGRFIVGHTSTIPIASTLPAFLFAGDSTLGEALVQSMWSNDNTAPAILLAKSRSATKGSFATLSVNDIVGRLRFIADDGSDLNTPAAEIRASVHATISTSQVPTRLGFYTAPGLSADDISEKMRIGPTGNVGILPTTQFNLDGVAATGDTYITESSANVLDLYTAGTNILRLTSTSATFAAVVVPSANDGAALGTTALKWSDLHLADGGVINWNNSDVRLVHSSDLLTLTGGDLLLSGGPRLYIGSVPASGFGGTAQLAELHGTGTNAGASFGRWSNDASGVLNIYGKSRGAIGAHTTVADADSIAQLLFRGSDGTDGLTTVATITVLVEGAVSGNRIPGVINFGTAQATSDNSNATKFSIGPVGHLGILATARIYLDGVARSGNTYLYESGADLLDLVAGAVNVLRGDGATALADGDTSILINRRAAGVEALTRVQWKDFSSLVAGDKVMVLAA